MRSGPDVMNYTIMDYFRYRDRTLFCEDVPVAELAAAYGTPLFVYSRRPRCCTTWASCSRRSPRPTRSSATASRPTRTSTSAG